MKRIENPSLSWTDNDQPFSEGFGDVYFHRKNGLEESRLVFLSGNNLPDAWQGQAQFTIAETGFGSGLNFLAAWQEFEKTAEPHQRLDFISFEKYPMHKNDLKRTLDPWRNELGDAMIDRMLDIYPLRIPGFHRRWVTDRVTLTLVFDDALRGLEQLDCPIDAWFLDGFAPVKNDDLWNDDVIAHIARLSHSATTLGSFTAVGDVRRSLAKHGFTIKREKGYAWKWHRTTGVFNGTNIKPITTQPKQITIMGAGLAGASIAYALKRRGIECTLLEKNAALGLGASGNRIGLVNPKIEAQHNPRSDAGLGAYSFALHALNDIQKNHDIDFQQNGALHLAFNNAKSDRLHKIYDLHAWLHPHMQWINKGQTTEICGLPCPEDGVFYPDAASLHTKALVKALTHGMDIQFNQSAAPHTGTVIYANGFGLHETHDDLPLQAVRGQVTYATIDGLQLKCPIMFGSYIAPLSDGSFCMGATFQKNNTDASSRPEDTSSNIHAVSTTLNIAPDTIHPTHDWSNIRTASRDRFAICGTLNEHEYVCGALGSHGIQFGLLMGEIIACQISGAPAPLGRDALAALSVERLLTR